MPRDYRKLKVFQKADDLVVAVYRATSKFPKNEMFGLTSQLRRAIVSVPANIAEGSARHTEAEFLNFLNIAYGSLTEASYYIDLSRRLGYLSVLGGDVKNKLFPFTSLRSDTAGVRFQSRLAVWGQYNPKPRGRAVHFGQRHNRHSTRRKALLGGAELHGHLTTNILRNSFDVIALMFSTVRGNQPVLRTSWGQGMVWFNAAA